MSELIGKKEATELMKAFPNFDWNKLANKNDIKLIEKYIATFRTDINELKSKVNTLQR